MDLYPYPERAAPLSAACASRLERWPLSGALALLTALPTAPTSGRAYVRDVLTAWGMTSFTEAAELVVTELMTNAVRASARASPDTEMHFLSPVIPPNRRRRRMSTARTPKSEEG